MNGVEVGLIAAAVLYGFRHGFDLDHLAALGDITGSATDRRRALKLSTLYVTGHAAVVLVLGLAAILAGAYIPESLDVLMGRVIGVTLIALGLYLTWAVLRYGSAARFRSRWMLAADGLRAASRRFRSGGEAVVIEHAHEHSHDGTHEHRHDELLRVENDDREKAGREVLVKKSTHSHSHTHVATMPSDPFRERSAPAAFGIGMAHGIGAETPTQVLLFASAAGASSMLGGGMVLVAFLVGLVAANSLVAVATAFGFAKRERFPRLYVTLALTAALFSLVLGVTYLAGGEITFGFALAD